jgi:hypothetical protein
MALTIAEVLVIQGLAPSAAQRLLTLLQALSHLSGSRPSDC